MLMAENSDQNVPADSGAPPPPPDVPYAAPEQQAPVRFRMYYGGWILIAVILALFAKEIVDWLRTLKL